MPVRKIERAAAVQRDLCQFVVDLRELFVSITVPHDSIVENKGKGTFFVSRIAQQGCFIREDKPHGAVEESHLFVSGSQDALASMHPGCEPSLWHKELLQDKGVVDGVEGCEHLGQRQAALVDEKVPLVGVAPVQRLPGV